MMNDAEAKLKQIKDYCLEVSKDEKAMCGEHLVVDDILEIINGKEEGTAKMTYKERCADCACLVAGDNDEWICDELSKPCSEVVNCPEEDNE